jgi:hypothetical protein
MPDNKIIMYSKSMNNWANFSQTDIAAFLKVHRIGHENPKV